MSIRDGSRKGVRISNESLGCGGILAPEAIARVYILEAPKLYTCKILSIHNLRNFLTIYGVGGMVGAKP